MPFPFDKYPWVNFHELNLAYFIKHFREIFQQWDELYNGMLAWKADTDEELETWKNGVMDAIDNWEHDFSAAIQVWQQETETDLDNWKITTLAALDAWKTATEAVFESIRVQAAGSASAAAQSANDADSARAAAVTAQTAAENAASRVENAMSLISENTAIIDMISEHTRNIWTLGDVNVDTANGQKSMNVSIPAGTYTISAEIIKTDPSNTRVLFYKNSITTQNLLANPYILKTTGRGGVTFTIAEQADIVTFYSAVSASTSAGVTALWHDIQLENGEAMTEYITPYIAFDPVARDDAENLEARINAAENELATLNAEEPYLILTSRNLSAQGTIFGSHNSKTSWAGWASPSYFPDDHMDEISQWRGVGSVFSFGIGNISRGAIIIQRDPCKIMAATWRGDTRPILTGTAKMACRKKDIAFFGDSILWGRDGDASTVTQVTWTIPKIAEYYLGAAVYNYAVGSQGWIATGGGRNALQELEYHSADLPGMSAIIMCWGVNDYNHYTPGDPDNPASGTIIYQVDECMNYLAAVAPLATPIIIGPWNSPSGGSAPKYKYGLQSMINLDSALKAYCSKWMIPYISQLESPMNGKNMLSFFSSITADRVHPTQDGYMRLGEWVSGRVQSIIG